MPVLCQLQYHRTIKQIQGHKFVDFKSKGAVKEAQILSPCIACPVHAEKTIELICVDHDDLCCLTCATVYRGYRQVEEVAALVKKSPDITTTMTQFTDAKAHIKEIVNILQK